MHLMTGVFFFHHQNLTVEWQCVLVLCYFPIGSRTKCEGDTQSDDDNQDSTKSSSNLVGSEPSSSTKRSTVNCGPMSVQRFQMIWMAVDKLQDSSNAEFIKANRKYLFESGKTSLPNFVLCNNGSDERTLYRVMNRNRAGEPTKLKEVVHIEKASEIIESMHKPHNGPCLPAGITKLKQQFMMKYYLKGCQHLVSQVLSECQGTCRRTKVLQTSAPPPIPVRSSTNMERVQIDLLHMYGTESPFNETANHNYRVILSVMDCFSKYCWVVPLTSKAIVEVAFALCHIFREFGCPNILHSDNGGEFVSNLVNQICSVVGIHKLQGRAYHPQSQGQVERLNRKVKQYLCFRLLSFDKEHHSSVWPWLLPEISHFLNNTWHSTINVTPFQVFFGRESGHYGVSKAIGLWPTDQYYLKFIQSMQPQNDQIKDDEVIIEEFVVDNDESDLPVDFPLINKDSFDISSLNIARQEQQLRTTEYTERASYRNCLSHMKRFTPKKFAIGDHVLFKHQQQYGMVTLLNQEGVIAETLPGNYYRVSFSEAGETKKVTLYGSSIASSTTALPTSVTPDFPNRTLPVSDSVVHEIGKYSMA